MDLTHYLNNIHWIAAIVVTLLSFGLGFLWYSPFLFGKTWEKELHHENKKKKLHMKTLFTIFALLHLISAAGLSALVSGKGALVGYFVGFMISIVWMFPAFTVIYLFANRSVKLLFIDSGFYIVFLSLAGIILGIW